MNAMVPRYVPKGATKVADKKSAAVAYVYQGQRNTGATYFAVIAYYGNQTKPLFHYSYKSEVQRNLRVIELFSAWQAIEARKAERKAEAKAAYQNAKRTLEVGHVLKSSWGYEQTNVDFYQVTKLVGDRSVEIRKIKGTITEETGAMSGKCMPLIGEFCGEPMVKRVSPNGWVKISDYATASVWSGQPAYVSWYG